MADASSPSTTDVVEALIHHANRGDFAAAHALVDLMEEKSRQYDLLRAVAQKDGIPSGDRLGLLRVDCSLLPMALHLPEGTEVVGVSVEDGFRTNTILLKLRHPDLKIISPGTQIDEVCLSYSAELNDDGVPIRVHSSYRH